MQTPTKKTKNNSGRGFATPTIINMNVNCDKIMNRNEIQNKVKQICNKLIYKQGYISSIHVLNQLSYLSDDNIKDWRFGKIPYLEKVCNANLATLSFVNKTVSAPKSVLKY